VPGWGDLRDMRLTMVLAVVTPTRDCVATSPLKGEVGFPLLPDGEKRQIAAASTAYSHARKNPPWFSLMLTWPGRWKVPQDSKFI
jgi:hypothetical protein